jgi:F-type H+-transporting ATPase subunit epsilon
MAKLTVEIVTAERKVYEGEVDMVVAPGAQGSVGILPRHAPLLTTLVPGVVTLKRDGEEELLAIGGGFLQVNANRVLVLADSAEREDEIDEERAQRARARALQAMQEYRGENVQAEAARLALRRSLVRLQVVQRRKRRGSPQ